MSYQLDAFKGTPGDYSWAITGDRILIAPADTALPTDIEPLDLSNIATNAAGWTDLGPTENSDVNINITRQSEAIQTGTIPTDRRLYLTGQEGTLEATLMRFEPVLIGYNAGQDPETRVAASGGNRAYTDVRVGGTLGDTYSLLVFKDFDIPLVTDDGVRTYDQVWSYTPNAQSDGDVNLSAKVNKSPVVAFRMRLLGFEVSSDPYSRLMIQRWIEAA